MTRRLDHVILSFAPGFDDDAARRLWLSKYCQDVISRLYMEGRPGSVTLIVDTPSGRLSSADHGATWQPVAVKEG